ncbi:MAG: hypothetical protein RR404_01325 [Bacilli bacterium]
MKKNLDRYVLILIIVVLTFLLILYGVNIFKEKSKVKSKIEIIDKIEDYNYILENTMTNEYKKVFKKLVEVLKIQSIEEEKYVSLISQLFIMDFYTLNDKLNNTDIGGIEFVFENIKENFKLKATNTIYKYLESNIYGERKQELPVVRDVVVNSIKKISYKYNSIIDEKAYQISVKWIYEKDLEYEKEKMLYFVHEGKKLSLVEMK